MVAWLLVYTVRILPVAGGPVYFVRGGLEVEKQEEQKEREVELRGHHKTMRVDTVQL